MKQTFLGKVEGIRFVPDNVEEYIEFMRTLEGRIEMSIGVYKLTRSDEQNKYYWGKVVKAISEKTGHSKDETHALLGSMFLKDHVDVKEGDKIKRYTVIKSTTSLKTDEMAIYIEKCKQFASATLNIFIPD